MNITRSSISGNRAALGGGIYNTRGGTVTVTNSLISGNRAGTDSLSSGDGSGAGICNCPDYGLDVANVVIVTNTTISGNVGVAFVAFGGGIDNSNPFAVGTSTLTVTNSTITANSATGAPYLPGVPAGGGISNEGFGSTASIRNTIIARNVSDVSGSFTSQGYNLIGAQSSNGFNQATDLTGTTAAPLDPLLGPLQDNGGPTHTRSTSRKPRH